MAYRINPENPGTVEVVDASGKLLTELSITYDLTTDAEGRVVAIVAPPADATHATISGSGTATATINTALP